MGGDVCNMKLVCVDIVFDEMVLVFYVFGPNMKVMVFR